MRRFSLPGEAARTGLSLPSTSSGTTTRPTATRCNASASSQFPFRDVPKSRGFSVFPTFYRSSTATRGLSCRPSTGTTFFILFLRGISNREIQREGHFRIMRLASEGETSILEEKEFVFVVTSAKKLLVQLSSSSFFFFFNTDLSCSLSLIIFFSSPLNGCDATVSLFLFSFSTSLKWPP